MEQLGRWLREHPGVEVACRDGSLTYRQGITAGAPDALQVSDRFHLWQGLSRRVQDIASAHRGCLPAALPPVGEAVPASVEETAENTAANTRAGRHARRLFEAVHALTRTGRSHSSVARELGLDRRTVRTYARAHTWQEVMHRPPRTPSTLDPYLDYLQQRWDEGQHSAKILHEELQTKGYLGHYQRVKMAVTPLRRGLPLDEPRERPPSPREAARWVTTHPDRRSPHINDRLPRLLDQCPELRHTHDLVRRFAITLDNRDATLLPGWLDDLANSGLAPLAGLAGAMREDRHAVTQGISTPDNSGGQRRPHHRREAPKTPDGRPRRHPASPPPRRPDRPPPPPLCGPADHHREIGAGPWNLTPWFGPYACPDTTSGAWQPWMSESAP
ncbi:hypothetical protein [Streptomyces sp. NPDC000229]|uniref:hypothetical protein n=1 Tax=Streptomyces sp. NPDC000229 TaxID=3154247 RepID=UPI00332D2E44